MNFSEEWQINMCLYPKLIENRKYTATKKNGGAIPLMKDKRTALVQVPCGKCIVCKRKKTREWNIRLQEELRKNKEGYFITLTFRDEAIKYIGLQNRKLNGYNKDNWIAKRAVRLFLERWRKKYKKSVRHWLVTELGHEGTENIHIHGIIWTDKEKIKELNNIWSYGFTHVGKYCNEKTINYITKYIHKTDILHKTYEPKILTSAGIGKTYINRLDAKLNEFKGKETNKLYTNRQGYKMALPDYYKKKIYNDEEREKIWINFLDEKKTYINKIEINLNEENSEEYIKDILEQQRGKNERLGYGSSEKNWELKRYENDKRNENYKKRIERGEKRKNTNTKYSKLKENIEENLKNFEF